MHIPPVSRKTAMNEMPPPSNKATPATLLMLSNLLNEITNSIQEATNRLKSAIKKSGEDAKI